MKVACSLCPPSQKKPKAYILHNSSLPFSKQGIDTQYGLTHDNEDSGPHDNLRRGDG